MTQYCENRKKGKRGQGDNPVTEKVLEAGFGSNRKHYRRRVIDRDFTKPNVAYRTEREKDPFKGHVVNDYSFQLDKPDPTATNKKRFLRQRREREASSPTPVTPKEGNK